MILYIIILVLSVVIAILATFIVTYFRLRQKEITPIPIPVKPEIEECPQGYKKRANGIRFICVKE
jgi:hypothetical protein